MAPHRLRRAALQLAPWRPQRNRPDSYHGLLDAGRHAVIEALFVMMNSYFHDLSVAFLWASSLMAHLVLRHWTGEPPRRLVEILRRVAWGSLVWVIFGGAVRAWFFQEYEWSPRAGTAQIPALAVKHVLLFALTIWGLVGVVRLRDFRPRDTQ